MDITEENLIFQINEKHKNYIKNLVAKKNYIDSVVIRQKRYPVIDRKSGTFFHMITKDYNEKTDIIPCKLCQEANPCGRLFIYNPLLLENPPRKICKHRINAICFDDFFKRNLKIWRKTAKTPKGPEKRIMCYDDDKRYLLILKETNTKILYWSGYPIDHEHQHTDLITEYNLSAYKIEKNRLS